MEQDKMNKKVISIILIVAVLLALLAITVAAKEEGPVLWVQIQSALELLKEEGPILWV